MSDQQNALNNIERAIQKSKRFGDNPCINSYNLNGSTSLTLEDVKQEILKGDKFHVKVWSQTEAEVKAKISKITSR